MQARKSKANADEPVTRCRELNPIANRKAQRERAATDNFDQQTSFAQLEPNQLVDLAGSFGNLGTALKAVSLASSAAKRSSSVFARRAFFSMSLAAFFSSRSTRRASSMAAFSSFLICAFFASNSLWILAFVSFSSFSI